MGSLGLKLQIEITIENVINIIMIPQTSLSRDLKNSLKPFGKKDLLLEESISFIVFLAILWIFFLMLNQLF